MPSLANDNIAAGYWPHMLSFAAAQVAINQAAVALKLNVNAATSGALNLTGLPAPFAGSIVGLTAVLTANKTAGVMTLTPTINGTAITTPASLVAVAVANATLQKVVTTDAQQVGARFKAGDLLGVKLTTDAAYLPITNDLYVQLLIVFEGVQF